MSSWNLIEHMKLFLKHETLPIMNFMINQFRINKLYPVMHVFMVWMNDILLYIYIYIYIYIYVCVCIYVYIFIIYAYMWLDIYNVI